MSGGLVGRALSRSWLLGHSVRSLCGRDACGSCRTRGRRKNASPTGPWTAHRARRPQAPQALLSRSLFNKKAVTPELLSKWRDEGTQSYFLKWLDRGNRQPRVLPQVRHRVGEPARTRRRWAGDLPGRWCAAPTPERPRDPDGRRRVRLGARGDVAGAQRGAILQHPHRRSVWTLHRQRPQRRRPLLRSSDGSAKSAVAI